MIPEISGAGPEASAGLGPEWAGTGTDSPYIPYITRQRSRRRTTRRRFYAYPGSAAAAASTMRVCEPVGFLLGERECISEICGGRLFLRPDIAENGTPNSMHSR
jgi:hypothetical protein